MPNLQRVSLAEETAQASSAPSRSSTRSKGKAPAKAKISDDDDDENSGSASHSSDDIDGSDFEETRRAVQEKKRKTQGRKEEGSGWGKKAKLDLSTEDDNEDDDLSDVEGEDSSDGDDEKGSTQSSSSVKAVRSVVKAPTTGHVPAGRVSQNTFNFLFDLTKPECNDREWYWANESRVRLAQKEWNAFCEEFTNKLMEIDTEIPYLPPKDIVHRLARDIRFSNDQTPYKKNLSASWSRGGRKGIFAHYHVMIMPSNRSMFAAGVWGPGKDELALIRTSILRSSKPLRKVLAKPEFMAEFGEPKPFPAEKKKPKKKMKKGENSNDDDDERDDDESQSTERRRRRSVFGGEDALKVAPKGMDKNHPDIELLKLRSVAVIKHYTDKEVLSPKFQDELIRVAEIARPFVHLINSMVVIPADGISDATESGDEDETTEGDNA